MEVANPSSIFPFGLRESQPEHQAVCALKTRIDASQLPEAPSHQPRTNQQNKSERYLCDYEDAAYTMAFAARGPAPGSFLQRIRQVADCLAECREKSKEDTRTDRDDGGEEKNASVDPDLLSSRNGHWSYRYEGFDAEMS